MLDVMNRGNFLEGAAAAAGVAAIPAPSRAARQPLQVPSNGRIVTAFIVSQGANTLDMIGPWETFQDVVLPSGEAPFQTIAVSDTTDPVEMTGGLRVLPAATFATAPPANVIVIGAQHGSSTAMLEYVRERYAAGALVMSVCTGAFKLAMTGLLDGKSATTHHEFYDAFSRQFPRVRLVRAQRFVDEGRLVTAGGITSGIEAAMHVVSRYFDGAASARVARYMEFSPTARLE